MAWWKHWKVWESTRADGSPKTINILMGYFILMNYCIGTGFLGIPYAFFYSGYLASIPTLIFAAFSAWVTSRWLLEVMSRAQAVETYQQSKANIGNGDVSKGVIGSEHQNAKPEYKITIYRKFENVELCQIFVGKWFKYVYLIIFAIFGILANWSYASVAGSAWSSNIPFNFGKMTMCDDNAFHHTVLPQGGCLHSYYFSVFIFGVIVVTLSIMDLKEQLFWQVLMGFARYFTVIAILVYCFVKLVNAHGNDVCDLVENTTLDNGSYIPLYNASRYTSFKEIVTKFDPKGWLVSLPVYLFAFEIQSGVSSLTHPVKQKKYIHWMTAAVFVTALLCFLSLGIVVPLWFKATVQETITLNWISYSYAGNSPQLRALSYYLILFPTLDVMSAFPLNTICVSNNIYMALTGRDTSEIGKGKYDWIIRLLVRLFTAILPLVLAFAAANLVFILKYAGLLGFAMYFLFPAVLQLRSSYVCNKIFGQAEDNEKTESMMLSTSRELENSPLVNAAREEKKSLWDYTTPYSSIVLSHPIFVTIIGVLGFCFFVISSVSLFIGPHKESCEYP